MLRYEDEVAPCPLGELVLFKPAPTGGGGILALLNFFSTFLLPCPEAAVPVDSSLESAVAGIVDTSPPDALLPIPSPVASPAPTTGCFWASDDPDDWPGSLLPLEEGSVRLRDTLAPPTDPDRITLAPAPDAAPAAPPTEIGCIPDAELLRRRPTFPPLPEAEPDGPPPLAVPNDGSARSTSFHPLAASSRTLTCLPVLPDDEGNAATSSPS